MSHDIMSQLSREHEELRTRVQSIQQAIEAGDVAALTRAIEAGRGSLGAELDAHIAAEEGRVFALAESSLGTEMLAPFRAEHREIEALRDLVLGESGADEPSRARWLELCDRILEHQQREDVMLFPMVREALASSSPRPS